MSKNKVQIKEWRYEDDGEYVWKIYDENGRLVVRAAMEENQAALIVESVNSHIVMLKECKHCGEVVCKNATRCLHCHSNHPHSSNDAKSVRKDATIVVMIIVFIWIMCLIW